MADISRQQRSPAKSTKTPNTQLYLRVTTPLFLSHSAYRYDCLFRSETRVEYRRESISRIFVGGPYSGLPSSFQDLATDSRNVCLTKAEPTRRGEDGAIDGVCPYTARSVTFSELDKIVGDCSIRIKQSLGYGDFEKIGSGGARPVALYLESDLGLFAYLAALMSLNIPVLLLSARLGASSIQHLLEKANAGTLLVSQRTQGVVPDITQGLVDVKVVEPYHAFLSKGDPDGNGNLDPLIYTHLPHVDENDCNAIILHSSGTTGLPKPIFMAHRYLLGYASCHQFPAEQSINWINVSTLPLYHGFGLLAPCLSLSVGMVCCFPPPSVIPAAHSTLDLIRTVGAGSLMSVPSILQDILSLPEHELGPAMRTLQPLQFVAVGGGPLGLEYAASLAKHQVNLLIHYGVTEIGALAPIFSVPDSNYNWRYIRLRIDLGLELRPVPNSPYFRIVGFPCGWDGPFEVQDEVERNPDSPSKQHVEVRVLGRVDDLIVLKTGEKIMPRTIEERLSADGVVHTAVVVGQGRFEIAVLIEPSSKAPSDTNMLVDHIWELICDANSSLDQHAQISSKKAIIIKPAGKTVPRSDKGSVMRRETVERFQEEIEAAYAALESDSFEDNAPVLDHGDVGGSIRRMLASVAGGKLAVEELCSEDDFFEHGMDSLQSIRLARLISSSLRTQQPQGDEPVQLKAEFVYQNPTLQLLTDAVARLATSSTANGIEKSDRGAEMTALVDEYIDSIRRTRIPQAKHVVLMTGSTGSLGAQVLARLARTKSVGKIICLSRSSRAAAATANGTTPQGQEALLKYQRNALSAAGIPELGDGAWDKIELLDADNIIISHDDAIRANGLAKDLPRLEDLASQVTHIIYLAWPMDFQRTLSSFRPHLDLVRSLIELARHANAIRPGLKVRLLFASSIAAVRYHESDGAVPEAAVTDPLAAAPMGYAGAKWVCERMLDQAGNELGAALEPVVVRIGQLSGPEETQGTWKTGEHIPALVKASQLVGAFPDLEGTASWIPVDHAAKALVEMALSSDSLPHFLHLENPIRQPARDMMAVMARELGLSPSRTAGTLLSFEEWMQKAVQKGAMVASLEEFFRERFRVLGQGTVILDTTKARAVSRTLRGERGVGADLLSESISICYQGDDSVSVVKSFHASILSLCCSITSFTIPYASLPTANLAGSSLPVHLPVLVDASTINLAAGEGGAGEFVAEAGGGAGDEPD
ncbi:hypothetical protein B0T17DRAFT_602326 [Bombardia bombarda]|uniref:Carrier domain-containing protein n=1 Tax=Bombardia bombarda TaxID=252184 RepID=A0AA39WH31_9PEZI|nr:hypothetical protein B0T17DRAFT_602326 [Bombardia bombarda]